MPLNVLFNAFEYDKFRFIKTSDFGVEWEGFCNVFVIFISEKQFLDTNFVFVKNIYSIMITVLTDSIIRFLNYALYMYIHLTV